MYSGAISERTASVYGTGFAGSLTNTSGHRPGAAGYFAGGRWRSNHATISSFISGRYSCPVPL